MISSGSSSNDAKKAIVTNVSIFFGKLFISKELKLNN